jgi:thioesterase domain-containing protein
VFTVSVPTTDEDLSNYFHFRWLWLREPWGYPEGSEKDEYETVGEHRVVKRDGQIVACGRVHLNTSEEAQIRHVAVDKACQRQGVGQIILDALEQVARDLGASRAVTNSRESSIDFFTARGFTIIDDAPAELGKLKRKQMLKTLVDNNVLNLHPKWCKELQDTWHDQIPISAHMGIKLHKYTERTLETRASLNKNINLHGTMFAGSIYSLATLTGWGMIYLTLKQKRLNGDIVLGDANIQYTKPVRKNPRGICNIETMKAKFDVLKAGKKCSVSLKVCIYDTDEVVAEFVGQYWVLPQSSQD